MRTVVHYTDSRDFGGAEQMLVTVLGGLDERWGSILYHHDEPGLARLRHAARQLGVPTVVVPPIHRENTAGHLPGFIRRLRMDRPAVFHAHMTWPLRCSAGILGARVAGVPAIVATQQLFRSMASRRTRWRHRILSLAVDRFIAVSDEMCRQLQPVCLRNGRVSVIRNAVDTAPFDEATAASPLTMVAEDSRLIVLTLARLHPQKGLEHLLAAAVRLPDARFVLAGDGPERSSLVNLAHTLGVADRVSFLGPRSDAPRLLAGCDVFVLPSLYEGLPVSILEAMAAGKPVVATAVGGSAEAVVDGVTGLLVPPRDPAALAAAIRRLLRDPELRQRFGRAGRARVEREFSAASMLRQVESLYDELLYEAGVLSAG